MSANANNISFRQGLDGLGRPLTYEELDTNFQELKKIILDTQDQYTKSRETNTYKLVQLSKQYFDSLVFMPNNINDVFSIVGEQIQVDANQDMYKSELIVLDQQIKMMCSVKNRSSGILRFKINAYDSAGTLITGTVGDYSINGVDKAFSAAFDAGDSNSECVIEIPLTSVPNAEYIELEIRSGTTQFNAHSINVEYIKGWYEEYQ